MRKQRWILILATALAVIALSFYWIMPVALSIRAAREAPRRARIVPVELKDLSISPAAGSKLSYFGHEFELPWSDVDSSKTNLNPKLNLVVLTFRSGLEVSVITLHPKEFKDVVTTNFMPQRQLFEPFVASEFGSEATRSDYEFLKDLYGFTPEKMNRWALSSEVHIRECMLLKIKSALLPWAADSGIFRVRSPEYRGFQQGSPQARQTDIVVDLFSEQDDAVEVAFRQKDYQSPGGVSQPEINRVIQSLHKIHGEGQIRGQTGRPPFFAARFRHSGVP